MQTRNRLALTLGLAAMALATMRGTFLSGRGGKRRRPQGHGKELRDYRDHLAEKTARIDGRLASAADTIDALRRRAESTPE